MKVMVTGHRPPAIGGYRTPNPTEQWIRNNLRLLLRGMKERNPDLEAITGMALGADQIFAEVCIELEIPFIAAVPLEGQESKWPSESRARYDQTISKAKKVVVVDKIRSYHSDRFGGKLALRNKSMVDHSDKAIAVWDGSDGGTANCVQLLLRKGRKFVQLDHKSSTVLIKDPGRDAGPDVFDLFGE